MPLWQESEMGAQLRIKTFGGPSIGRGEVPSTGLASRKAEALLVYLACNSRLHPLVVLADLIWKQKGISP